MDQFLDIIKIAGPVGSIPVIIFSVYKTVEIVGKLIDKYIQPGGQRAQANLEEHSSMFRKFQELQKHINNLSDHQVKLETNHMAHFKADMDDLTREVRDIGVKVNRIEIDVAVLKDRQNI